MIPGGPYRVPGEVIPDREPTPLAVQAAAPEPEQAAGWENAVDGMAFVGKPRIAEGQPRFEPEPSLLKQFAVIAAILAVSLVFILQFRP